MTGLGARDWGLVMKAEKIGLKMKGLGAGGWRRELRVGAEGVEE